MHCAKRGDLMRKILPVVVVVLFAGCAANALAQQPARARLVFSGQIRYAFEGQAPFIASEGDVVSVPANTWHATRFIGDSACRLSITE